MMIVCLWMLNGTDMCLSLFTNKCHLMCFIGDVWQYMQRATDKKNLTAKKKVEFPLMHSSSWKPILFNI